MTTTVVDDIWAILREVAQAQKETERRFQETDLKFQETDRKFQETDRKFQETDRQLKETDLRLRKLDELFESQWGKLMESLVEGDLVGILNRQGIEISDTTTRLKGRIAGGGNYEFDIVAHNGHEIVVVEVKTTLRPQDVRKFIYKLENIKQWIPRYAGNTIYGGMAWLTTTAGAEEMAEKRGLFSIRATGDSASIVNAQNFHPRAW